MTGTITDQNSLYVTLALRYRKKDVPCILQTDSNSMGGPYNKSVLQPKSFMLLIHNKAITPMVKEMA